MKSLPLTATLALLVLTFSAVADTFIMKDGSKLDATILHEDATTYRLEINFSKGIKDERVVKKEDVVKIERVLPDQVAFAVISTLTPTPDLLTAEDYGKRIRAVEKFLNDYRMTAKSKDAQGILATLKGEANEVLAGGIKLNGKIVPATERVTNTYDIDARIQEAKIRRLVNAPQLLQALRAFSEFGNDFRNTKSFHDLVPLMAQVITSYMEEIGQSLATFDARVKERKVGLERMPTADRRITENAIRDELAELEARYKKEKDARLGWVTTHPFFKPSLEETMAFARQELARLAAVKGTAVVDGGRAFREAMALIQAKAKSTEIATAISAAKNAMLPQRYLDILEAAAPASGEAPS